MKTSGQIENVPSCSIAMSMLRYSFILCSSFLGQPVLAQEAITITASRLPRTMADAQASQILLDAAQLRRQASPNLDDQLRAVAGFQTFRRASSRVTQPTTQGVTLRAIGGNGASRALVLRDGVPLEDPFGGWIPWSAINGAGVESVRIIRGGGGVTAGNDALTGVIEIDLAPVEPGVTADFNAAAGAFGTAQLSTHVSAAQDRFSADITAGAYSSNGYTLVSEAQRGTIDVTARSKARNINARFEFKVSDASRVQASVLHFTENKVNGFALASNASSGTDASLRLTHDGEWTYALMGYAKWRDFSSGFATASPGRNAATATVDQFDVPASGYGGGLDVRPPQFGPVLLRFGIDGKKVRGETNEKFRSIAGVFTRNRKSGGSASVIGSFIDASVGFDDRIILSGGVRLDKWWLRDANRRETDSATAATTLTEQAANRQGHQWSARLGATYKLAPALAARALVYTGWRLPTLNELHRPFRVGNDVTEANAALLPERLRGVDLGLHYQPINTISLDLTLFANELRNAIGNIARGAGPGVFPSVGFLPAGGIFRQRGNIDAVRVRGVEVTGRSQLPGGFSLDASVVATDGKISRADTALLNKQLTQAPKWQMSGQLGWRGLSGKLDAALTLRHVSIAFEDDQNLRTLLAYTTVDSVVRYQLNPGFSVQISGENLANSLIVSALATDGTITRTNPRNISIGVNFSF
jgi:vitamin B12 transporter